MKILKSMNVINDNNTNRQIANIGCYVCPTCGCNKIVDIYEDKNLLKSNVIVRTVFRCTHLFLFSSKSSRYIDKYKCNNCGTEWESEIY